MQNVKISTRLICLSAFLILGSIGLGLTGWATLNKVNVLMVTALKQSADAEQAVDVARKAQVDFKIQIQEWKNTLLRGRDPEAFDKYRASFIKYGEETQKGLANLKVIFGRLDLDSAQVDATSQALAQLSEKYLTALKQYEGDAGAKTVDALVKGMDREPTEKIDRIVDFVNASAAKIRMQNHDALEANASAATMTMMAAVIILTLLGAALTYWIITSVIRPLNSAIDIARTVAAGDLTTKIEVVSRDETGTLLHALKDMNENLVRIVSRVRQGTEAIATGSAEIATGNLDLSSRTEEQASALEETASSMEEITATVRQNADNARQANQFAASASDVAHRGREVVSQVVTTMESINEASRKIVDIIGVIDGIAFQTNLLALNASVEAARAGEQGRGFSVVASEVRSLAQRSATAAREIKALIGDSVERVDAGGKYVTQAGTTMEEIMESVRRVTDIMGEITAASEEQSAGIEQVNQAVGQMDQVTQQNAALVEEAAAAAASLQEQADQLKEAVGAFKLREGESSFMPPQRMALPA